MYHFGIFYHFVSLLNTITHTLSQDLTGSGCPILFEEYTNADLFYNYCSIYHFNLERVLEIFRNEVCYSKCTVSDTCWYYYYEGETSLCHVCLRKPDRFYMHGLTNEFVLSVNVPAADESFKARIGKDSAIEANEYLFFNCTSPYIGGSDGTYAPLGISLANGISQLRFCQWSSNYIGGFQVVSRDGASEVIGCGGSSISWLHHDPMVFANTEDIVQLDIYMNSYGIKAVNVSTSENNHYHFLTGTDFTADLTRTVKGNNIMNMDATIKHSGAILGAIQVQFEDCE